MNSRAAASKIISRVLFKGQSLSLILPEGMISIHEPRERALVQELCYGVLRRYYGLDFILSQLLEKPLKVKDGDITALLLLGLYQLRYLRIPSHAAVSETVAATRSLKKPWASGLVNGILRKYQRTEKAWTILPVPSTNVDFPEWLFTELQKNWPQDWEYIVKASNQQAPMTLRVNQQKITRNDYLSLLEKSQITATPHPYAEQGITLETPRDVQTLPGFKEGLISVQDAASQLVTLLLSEARSGQRVLDACAAPGGKTAAMLEKIPDLIWLALDNSEQRLMRVRENLQRLALSATVKQGDVRQPNTWWDGHLFDWILLDAPCSATGVIRRHPDIKILRKPDDIPALVNEQQTFLETLWPLLKPGGQLVYATCSILPAENSNVLSAFIATQSDAKESCFNVPWGRAMSIGCQILPGEEGMDGFYYGRLLKKTS